VKRLSKVSGALLVPFLLVDAGIAGWAWLQAGWFLAATPAARGRGGSWRSPGGPAVEPRPIS